VVANERSSSCWNRENVRSSGRAEPSAAVSRAIRSSTAPSSCRSSSTVSALSSSRTARRYSDRLVALHGTYHGFGPEPLVAFDLFRVEDGRLAEHWDALTPRVTPTASGRTQTDGPAEPDPRADTAANRALVTGFAQRVLAGADYSVLADYISTETYHQHNPEAADGLDGFGAAAEKWARDGKNLVYKTVHKVVAEGDFVLLQSEGEFGVPVAYWDLFRVDGGRIVEHWDVVVPVPDELPHGNGLF